jgi:hypothetical protein
MTTDKKLTTSDSLKDWLLSINANLFTLYSGKTKTNEITVKFAFDGVTLSDVVNNRLNAEEKQTALETALSPAEIATLASLQARVKAAEKALGDKLGKERPKDSRVTVKGMTASKA